MEALQEDRQPKPKTAQIGFRYGEKAKSAMEQIADKEGVDPSIVYRKVMTAGLKTVYDIDTFRNELVE